MSAFVWNFFLILSLLPFLSSVSQFVKSTTSSSEPGVPSALSHSFSLLFCMSGIFLPFLRMLSLRHCHLGCWDQLWVGYSCPASRHPWLLLIGAAFATKSLPHICKIYAHRFFFFFLNIVWCKFSSKLRSWAMYMHCKGFWETAAFKLNFQYCVWFLLHSVMNAVSGCGFLV